MMSRDEVYTRLARYLGDMFEVPEEKIRPEARLYEELDLDSIDALDLVVKLQELTGSGSCPGIQDRADRERCRRQSLRHARCLGSPRLPTSSLLLSE